MAIQGILNLGWFPVHDSSSIHESEILSIDRSLNPVIWTLKTLKMTHFILEKGFMEFYMPE